MKIGIIGSGIAGQVPGNWLNIQCSTNQCSMFNLQTLQPEN